MEVRAESRVNERTATEGKCLHCGLPLPPKSKTSFCCTGCSVAYEAIHLAGLDGTYYSLRNLADKAVGVPAKPSSASALSKQQIASDRFIRESTQELDDGSRRVCLAIDGLTCAACGWLAEQVVAQEPGMKAPSVNLPESTLTFEFDPDRASIPKLLDTLARFGYELHPRRDRPDGASPQEKKLLIKVGVSWALAGNIMLLAFALYSGLSLETDRLLAMGARWASLAIATVSLAFGGTVFFRTAAASLKIAIRNRSLKKLHIDTPISLGILVGYANSAWATVVGRGDVWFDSIAVLIAALLTARWLQTRSQRTAAQAASRLLDLVPSTARVLLADGSEDYIDSDKIEPGQSLRIDPGEVVPADGTVLSGRSSVNNAVITGESAPVTVSPGDVVYAGSINQSTPLVVRAESSGRNTRVGQLLQWLEDSTRHDAPVVQSADRISGYFVVGVLSAAIVTGLLGAFLFPGTAVYRIVALLVISCPCALGMATPLAIAAANGKAARRGIYVKDGATVERLAAVTTVVFDKTGTLTLGDLSVVEFTGSDDLFAMTAALERHSRHPIALAFQNEAQLRMLDVDGAETTQVEVVQGCGISGLVDGRAVSVGSPTWIAEIAGMTDELSARVAAIASEGFTPIAIAVDGTTVAAAGCGDQIRPGARDEISKLKNAGLNVRLLSGDHRSVVDRVAEQVGIPADDAYGEVGPEEKRRLVESWHEHEVVMMIGDGANDATALRTADVGVAVGNDNAPVLVASDIFVPRHAGAKADDLITFGQRTLRLIRRNLRVSLAYNVVAGSAAILGFVTPLVAAIAMPLSSLFVVSTSVAVRPFKKDFSEPQRPSAS